jgi:hypothetical protein
MATYLESTRAHCEQLSEAKTKTISLADAEATAQWAERLTPLEDRLAKLLATIPNEIKSQGLSLPAIRTMLAGKWRGKCHPGELGISLRKLGYQRKRNWTNSTQSFNALWFYIEGQEK